MPAVVAAGLLLLIVAFIFCGFTTWVLFQKRSEMAARTLRGSVIPAIQQSHLTPDEKQQVVELLTEVADQAESGALENWQASGIMNRLVRVPILEWGDLAAVEAMIAAHPEFDDDQRQRARVQLSRLRSAIESGQATEVDVGDVLAPVMHPDKSARGQTLMAQPTSEQLQEVVHRAALVADRSEVPDQLQDDVSLAEIVRRVIAAGRQEGTL